jgi:hypothetical protein
MMRAMVVAPGAREWLEQSQIGRVLHLFEAVCNLVNERGKVLSLVLPDVGAGPFNMIVEGQQPFTALFTADSPISIQPSLLQIGSVVVDMSQATLWQPEVDWGRLQRNTAVWQPHIPRIQEMMAQHWMQIGRDTARSRFGFAVTQPKLERGLAHLLEGISHRDTAVVHQATQQLAGLGRGLTPAGDDVLMGAIYGLWATLPEDVARPLLETIVATAVPQTTTLSAAWLRAAGRSEAGEAWHLLSERLAVISIQYSVISIQWEDAVRRILGMGHSSGAEALWGFTAVCAENRAGSRRVFC